MNKAADAQKELKRYTDREALKESIKSGEGAPHEYSSSHEAIVPSGDDLSLAHKKQNATAPATPVPAEKTHKKDATHAQTKSMEDQQVDDDSDSEDEE